MANTQNQSAGCVSQAFAFVFLAGVVSLLSTCFSEKKKPTIPVASVSPVSEPSDDEIRAMGRQWAAEDAAWQPPKGFEITDEMSDLRGRPVRAAVRWLKPSEYNCEIADRCWGLEVIPIQYCKRIYAEVTLLNSGDTNIGMTNDASSEVKGKTKARFVFETFENAAQSARLSELVCF